MRNHQNISGEDRKAAVASMFDTIASRYDFMNHFMSFGIDRMWRRKAIKIIGETHRNPGILDVATGTGDLAIAAMKLDPVHITGIDISGKMLEAGKEKIKKLGLSDSIELLAGDSENISYDDNYFDVAMVAFGVRNFADPLKGLSEMRRVIRRGGLIMVLEFSKPSVFPFRQIYGFYFLKVLPLIGWIFSKNSSAYRYLPESVMQFPDNELFLELMRNAGLTGLKQKKLSFGVASIYTGFKS
ncbi:MAG: bifunctional demethylmenaquinone methyltransferase/2-methoxy-6-polyprenyl-1,4-benzoquinol methylase UbiE [Bacteroidales bacterium]|jgi:demethylmenaquinone methyltransferase/2-methoxy-6-polyprenyl-1,4-benzoquinol methylase|nr:bifunctional demethylmenaquinone methyltransferase/2-methoxy-6-polyprenyl-1,4-benzoquinol methylase UbiE [Bacteroidales bacterium]